MDRKKPLIPTVVPTLVGLAEICVLLHVSRARVQQLTREAHEPERIPASRPPFPLATQILSMGAVWVLDDIVLWAEQSDRVLDYEALEEFQEIAPRKGAAGQAAAAALLRKHQSEARIKTMK